MTESPSPDVLDRGDPPRRRGRWRIPATTGAAVIAVAGVIAVTTACGAKPAPPAALSAPDTPGPAVFPWWEKEITVSLCSDNDAFSVCNDKGVTERQKRAIRAALEDFPGVKKVELESKQEAYEKNIHPRHNMTVEDMPESFQVEVGPDFDRQGFHTMARLLPGVSNVYDLACIFKPEKQCPISEPFTSRPTLSP